MSDILVENLKLYNMKTKINYSKFQYQPKIGNFLIKWIKNEN